MNINIRFSPTTETIAGETRQYMTLEITENASGLTLAQVKLGGPELLQFFSNAEVGSVDGIPAEKVISAEDAQHLGKHRVHVPIYLPHGDKTKDEFASWALAMRERHGARTAHVRSTNMRSLVAGFVFYLAEHQVASNYQVDLQHRLQDELTAWLAD